MTPCTGDMRIARRAPVYWGYWAKRARFDMILEPQEIVSGKNPSAKSSEIDFAIVLSRVIGSIENDPAQLRNAVYELARIKLQTELSQRRAPINVSEKGDLALALESAIDRVETVYSKHDHLRSLDRLTNSSEVDASEITIEGRKSALIIRPPPPILLICPAFRLESWVTAGRPSPHGTGWAPHPWQGRPWSLFSLSCCARCCIVNSAFSDAKPRSRSRRSTKLRNRKRN